MALVRVRNSNCTHLSCGVIDNLLRSQVTLVSDEKLVHIFTGIAIDFLQPLLDIVERLLLQSATSCSTKLAGLPSIPSPSSSLVCMQMYITNPFLNYMLKPWMSTRPNCPRLLPRPIPSIQRPRRLSICLRRDRNP